MEKTKTITKEGVLVVSFGKTIVSVIRRDMATGHQVVYKVTEAGEEDLTEIIA